METHTIQQEIFILYPYYGPATLTMDVHLVTDGTFTPFKAMGYNALNNQITAVTV